MGDNDIQILIRKELPGEVVTRRGVSGITTRSKAVIILASADRDRAKQRATDLEEALISFLRGLPGAREVQITGGDASSESSARKLLVIVGDEAQPVSNSDLPSEWRSTGGTSLPPCLPVFPAGSKISADELLPKDLLKLNAAFWTTDVAEILSRVLQMAYVVPDEPRVFISYKRDDSQGLAIQLFEELIRHRFWPFLDLYSIDTGIDFQEALFESLADKSFILVLESAHLLGSDWVRKEINFARENRLGLLAANINSAPEIPDVGADRRFHLSVADFESNRTTEKLKPDALERLMQRIKRDHDIALFLRRHDMRASFDALLQARRLTGPEVLPSGLLRMDKGVYRLRNDWAFFLTGRPPTLLEIHELCTAKDGLPVDTQRAILGPIPSYTAKRREMMSWLSECSKAAYFEEGQFTKLADDIANGRL